jgi:ubiquinone/menaquinone biosynthesis C-methylase UbiE
MKPEFKDLYSRQAELYSKYRPTYPDALFAYIASLVKEKHIAWDCATGNGQAASGLAEYFDKVIATDASIKQLGYAVRLANVEYRHALAEKSGLEPASIDLITVATAIHWINTEKFYREVKRIIKPGGIFAVWTYSTTNELEKNVKKVLDEYEKFLLPYWDKGIAGVWKFEDLYFPFDVMPSPAFFIERNWKYDDFLNYLRTWSSTQNYIVQTGTDPTVIFRNRFKDAWGEKILNVRWNIKMKITCIQ